MSSACLPEKVLYGESRACQRSSTTKCKRACGTTTNSSVVNHGSEGARRPTASGSKAVCGYAPAKNGFPSICQSGCGSFTVTAGNECKFDSNRILSFLRATKNTSTC